MSRVLSSLLSRELANLDKDAETHHSSMKSLKLHVRNMDSKAIPLFLAQVSEAKENGSVSGEYVVPLYEVLARTHGANIYPHVDNIVSILIKTLASSAWSFSLQQACSKVVSGIAKYGISPTASEDKKRQVIRSLCKPLSEALLGREGNLTSGAALCLKALVDSDNWKFATDEMVNRVCQNVAVALEEKFAPVNSCMDLVMALAKHNALIVEAYARLLIRSGLHILNAGDVDSNSQILVYSGAVESNSQKRLLAIQMVNFLMRSLDPRSIFSELELIIEEMRKCRADHQMAYMKGAANEALQTAKAVAMKKGSMFEDSCVLVNGLNFSRKDHRERRNLSDGGDQSPGSISPRSQQLDSIEYNAFADSPVSMQFSDNREYDFRSMNYKSWSNENGGIDVSLLELAQEHSALDRSFDISKRHEASENRDDRFEELSGSLQRGSRNKLLRSATPSPQRSHSRVSVDNGNAFTTPRKRMRSLQHPNDEDADFYEKVARISPCFSRCNSSATSMNFYENGFRHHIDNKVRENGIQYSAAMQIKGISESVSSTDDFPVDTDTQLPSQAIVTGETDAQKVCSQKSLGKLSSRLILSFVLALLAFFVALILLNCLDKDDYIVPT